MRPLPLCLLLAACAGAPSRPEARHFWAELGAPSGAAVDSRVFALKPLVGVDRRRVNRALDYYANGPVEKWEAERAELCADALNAYHLARTLSLFAYAAKTKASEQREVQVGTPAWERPIAEIARMGEAAVPCVIIDLLPSRHSAYRAIGLDVASRMGPDVLPTFRRGLEVQDVRTRRLAAGIIADWEPQPAVVATLHTALADEDFGVRAAAWRGLAQTGGGELEASLAALRDEDPFVQRAIAEGLRVHTDKVVVLALVEFLERAIQTRDRRAGETAEESLLAISGQKGRKSLQHWQNWAKTYAPATPTVGESAKQN